MYIIFLTRVVCTNSRDACVILWVAPKRAFALHGFEVYMFVPDSVVCI